MCAMANWQKTVAHYFDFRKNVKTDQENFAHAHEIFRENQFLYENNIRVYILGVHIGT